MKGIEIFQAAVKKDIKNYYLPLEKARLIFQSIMKRLRQSNTHEEDGL